MKKKVKKQPWEIVLKDRFLTDEKPENPYVVAALYFFVFFLSALLIFVCFFQLCSISGHSMENTFNDGDHVLLYQNVKTFKHNDIVVISKKVTTATGESVINVIKRVIAVPGDQIEFKLENGVVNLYRKSAGSEEFELLNESYIKEPMNTFSGDYAPGTGVHTISEGSLFVLGDNRNHSEDSRVDGAYWIEAVLGKMAIKVDRGSSLEWLLKMLYHDTKAPAT